MQVWLEDIPPAEFIVLLKTHIDNGTRVVVNESNVVIEVP